MAITFNTNIQNSACYYTFNTGVGLSNNQTGITIHSGARPTASAVAASWSTYKYGTSTFLASYSGGWGSIWTYTAATNSWAANTTPVYQASANNTGTATWACIWSSVPQSNPSFYYGQSSLPSSNFCIVDVSDTSGVGILRVSTTSFVASVNTPILDITMKMTSP